MLLERKGACTATQDNWNKALLSLALSAIHDRVVRILLWQAYIPIASQQIAVAAGPSSPATEPSWRLYTVAPGYSEQQEQENLDPTKFCLL